VFTTFLIVSAIRLKNITLKTQSSKPISANSDLEELKSYSAVIAYSIYRFLEIKMPVTSTFIVILQQRGRFLF